LGDSLSTQVRILVDYRPALRQRTGVGEYIHELVRALTRRGTDEVVVFTSSWRDRPSQELSAKLGAHVVDRAIPVRVLNALWHRTGWPTVEWLAGRADVVHAAHPLLIPSRQAAQVVTIHDLFFLTDPSASAAEIRRDYAALARPHARRAHAIVTSSEYGKSQVTDRLSVDPARIHVVPPGAPRWSTLGQAPNRPADGYLLFVGTLEPRKNIGTLLDAWTRVVAGFASPPPRLVLAGAATPRSHDWLRRLEDAPLAGTVEHRGYVPDGEREALYAGARALVLPSLDEGFGLPVLEAMSAGVPVIASRRGAIPEVTAGAAELIEPSDVEALATAIARVLSDDDHAFGLASRGLERARHFTWDRSADAAILAYEAAVARRRHGKDTA
jgi:glycosyltransferase involved in cell wall biosynthesis